MNARIHKPNFSYRCERIETAGRQGALGYLQHRSVEGNPYDPETGQYFAWLAGWFCAAAESKAYKEDEKLRQESER